MNKISILISILLLITQLEAFDYGYNNVKNKVGDGLKENIGADNINSGKKILGKGLDLKNMYESRDAVGILEKYNIGDENTKSLVSGIQNIFGNGLDVFGSFADDFGLSFKIKCKDSLPKIPSIDICKNNPFKDYDKAFGFNIGGCKIDGGGNANLKSIVDRLCGKMKKDVSDELKPTKQKQIDIKDGSIISNNVINNETIIDKETKEYNQKYPSGKTTKTLYGDGGVLTYKEVVNSDNNNILKQEMYNSTNNNRHEVYYLLKQASKTKKFSSNKEYYDHVLNPKLPYDNELDYETTTPLTAIVNSKEIFDIYDYYEKTKELINELKKTPTYKYNFSGSSSEMEQEYENKNKLIIKKLLDDQDTSSLYYKSIQDIQKEVAREYSYNRLMREHKNGYLISPSNEKMEMLPVSERPIYAYKVIIQNKIEIHEVEKYSKILKKRLAELKEKTEKAFYDNLEYQSIIIQTKIKEILGE